jgi:hypothetical protein
MKQYDEQLERLEQYLIRTNGRDIFDEMEPQLSHQEEELLGFLQRIASDVKEVRDSVIKGEETSESQEKQIARMINAKEEIREAQRYVSPEAFRKWTNRQTWTDSAKDIIWRLLGY